MQGFKRHILWFGLLALVVSGFWTQAHATVSNTTVSTTTAMGTGSTTNYTIGFQFLDNSWIVVTEYDTSTSPVTVTNIVNGAGVGKFTITGGNPGTTVVMGTAPSTTQYLIISRSVPLTQANTFSASSPFPYTGLSNQLDQITLELQNLNAASASSAGGGGGGTSTAIPTSGASHAYNLWGWDAAGTGAVNYGGASLVNGDILQFNGSSWVPYLLNQAGLISTINSGGTVMNPAVGGTGVANNGLLTWGAHALTFTTTLDTNVTLPTSGTLIAGTLDTANTANTIVKRDASGNFSAGTITAALSGNVTGNLTGNVTGNTSGTSANVTGTIAIGHGGTGQTTQAAAITALTGTQVAGDFLRSNGTNSLLAPIGTGDLPAGIPWSKMAAQTTNSLLWSDGSGNEGVIPTNVNSGYVLTSNGVLPTWAPQGSGIPGIYPYGVDTGLANAYVIANPNPPVVGYAVGVGVSFSVAHSNTGASTINVSSLGLKNVVHADGTPLIAGDLVVGKVALVEYDGTSFQLINPAPYPGGGTLSATTSATATSTQQFIDMNCAAACSVTLPAISALSQVYEFYVKNLSASTLTVQGTGLDTIDGAATATLNFQGEALVLVPRSGNWEIH